MINMNISKKNQSLQEKKSIASATAARWVTEKGGNKIAQEAAAIRAQWLIKQGKSVATAIEQGYKTGLKLYNNHLLQQQAG